MVTAAAMPTQNTSAIAKIICVRDDFLDGSSSTGNAGGNPDSSMSGTGGGGGNMEAVGTRSGGGADGSVGIGGGTARGETGIGGTPEPDLAASLARRKASLIRLIPRTLL